MFIALEKIDIKQRLVYGTIGAEEPDRAGEILDYASAKKAFQKWSDAQFEASGGKSYGNVRSMHNRTAAGKVAQPLHFDDQLKKISACVYVSDDTEWQKVQDGTFTGFSPGGGYAKIWNDEKNPALKRYTPVVIELSLVDVPCQPSATFACMKADGTSEMRKFKNVEEPGDIAQGFRAKDGRFFTLKVGAEKWNKYLVQMEKLRTEAENNLDHPALDALRKAEQTVSEMEEENEDDEDDEDEDKKKLKKAKLDEESREKEAKAGTAMPDGSFPIVNKEDLGNAVKAFGRAKNKVKAKAHIKKRAKALGAEEMLPKQWKCVDLQKGFGHVARLACIIEELTWLQQCVDIEEEVERDNESESPEALRAATESLIDIIKEMVEEEGSELGDAYDGKSIALPKDATERLTKFLAPVMKKIKIAEPEVESPFADELKKTIETVTSELATERKVTGELTKGLTSLQKRLEVIERQPMPVRGPLRAVDRGSERIHQAPELRKEVATDTPMMPAGLSPRDQRVWTQNQTNKK